MAGLTVGGFAAAVCVTVALAHAGQRSHPMKPSGVHSIDAAPVAAVDPKGLTQRSSTGEGGGGPPAAYQAWAAAVGPRIGVPPRALSAYAAAAQQVDADTAGCHLNWATLAGIGYVESRSGDMGGGLRPSGVPRRPIYGVQLDGAGPVAAIADSDGGRIDNDPAADRAVGPLQFLPSTWMTWGSDGDRDGVRDPQDVDDAALTAGRYLCATGALDTAAGWTAAVLSYNHSSDYVDAVFAAAETLAGRSRD